MSTFTDTPATTSPLALPVTLPNGASIKNRLVKAAMSEQLGGPANQPTAELARAYRRWAHGGAGLLITGNVMIDRRSIGEPLNVVVETSATSNRSSIGRPLPTAMTPPRWSRSITSVARPSPACPSWPLPPAPSRWIWGPRSPSRAP